MKKDLKSGKKITEKNSDLKFRLYESSVQSSDWQTNNLPVFHRRFTGKTAISMREDFSGTGRISCDWVKKSPRNRAVGLDLDVETLNYAKNVNQAALKPSAQERVEFLRQDVRKPTKEKFDIIGAHNFSFFIFLTRAELLAYAKAAYASLKTQGTFYLELAGGNGFITPGSASEKVRVPGVGKIDYVWEQHQPDPVQKLCDYSIHFKLPNGRWLNDAFTYHWRLWEIREVREILAEAGFKKTKVLWPKDETMREYLETETGSACDVWLAYIVGIKG